MKTAQDFVDEFNALPREVREKMFAFALLDMKKVQDKMDKMFPEKVDTHNE